MSFSSHDYQNVLAQLASLADPEYKSFHQRLIPGTTMAHGVRIPELRKIARAIIKKDAPGFLVAASPQTYEEIMLTGMVIGGMKCPIEERLAQVAAFLPLVDNWAVCDTFSTGLKLKSLEEKEAMWTFLLPLFSDDREFYARFAVVMFLSHFVEEPWLHQGLALTESMTQEAYYVRMAVAWAVSVCYVKFPQHTLPLLRRQALPAFTQNKAIQKIRESYRVPKEDKAMLLQYKLPA